MNDSKEKETGRLLNRKTALIGLMILSGIVSVGAVSLLTTIFHHKVEAAAPYVRLVEVTEEDTNPEKWGRNWPAQYDRYKQTAKRTSTKYGGHGGSESMPTQRIERDPWLQRMFLGYAFALDYRDRRGHAYMLQDQEATKRVTKPQTGSCMHCHSSIIPLYRQLGEGDVMKGFDASYKLSFQDMNKKLHDSGHADPVSCVDCHDPKNMTLRVTRPGFLRGIAAFAASKADATPFPSIQDWRGGNRKEPYDPNKQSTRNEMRSFVCGQCHVEYYCSSKMPLTFPWGDGLKVDDVEAFWNAQTFSDGSPFLDYVHKETEAPILKAQHPEFETWSQGIHARSGVSCADCHMPYMRDGATKISDHWVKSPLLDTSRACQTCHRSSEEEMKARVEVIQDRSHKLLERAGEAIVALIDSVVAAKKRGASSADLKPALEFQRKAQWRLDFVASENSMGFHAPQETARSLAEAIDFARQGQLYANGQKLAELSAPGAAPLSLPLPSSPSDQVKEGQKEGQKADASSTGSKDLGRGDSSHSPSTPSPSAQH